MSPTGVTVEPPTGRRRTPGAAVGGLGSDVPLDLPAEAAQRYCERRAFTPLAHVMYAERPGAGGA
jgi:hypothetical protein